MATKHGLARGLDALLPETDLPAGVTEIAGQPARSQSRSAAPHL